MGFLALLSANTKMQLRNRSALFWNFAFPVIMMSLLGLVFGGGGEQVDIGLVEQGRQSDISKTIHRTFSKIDNVEVVKGSKNELIKRLKNDDLDAVIVMSKLQEPEASSNKEIPAPTRTPKLITSLEIYRDPSNALTVGLVDGLVTSVIERLNREASRAPSLFKVNRHSVRSERLNYISFLLPGVIGMAVMFSSLFGTAFPLVNEREKGILRRLRVTPLKTSVFVTAKAIGAVVISLLQAILIIFVGLIFFGVEIVGNYGLAALIIFMGSIVFVILGFVVSGIAKKIESVDAIANVIAMPMMFLSGVFFPVEQAPSWMQPIINILPLTYFNNALRDILIKGEAFSAIKFDLLFLLGAAVVLFLLSLRLFRWEIQPS